MSTILTLARLMEIRARYVRPIDIRVFDFREQWRFPRTKKRRIRKKWTKAIGNWRSIKGRCYEIKGSLGVRILVMGPDVFAEINREISSPESK